MFEQVYSRDYYVWQREGSLRSAQRVVPRLLQIVQPKSVIDVGCGVGMWLKVMLENGVNDFEGLDGPHVDPSMLMIPPAAFHAHDLTQPIRKQRTFDLALCLEVAEHLPAICAGELVASLVRLAPLVLFSAAIPLQGGTNHLNEQWPEYWADLFLRHNYWPVDCLRRDLWQDQAVDWWYAQNTLLYANAAVILRHAGLRREFAATNLNQLALVHPKCYLLKNLAAPAPT